MKRTQVLAFAFLLASSAVVSWADTSGTIRGTVSDISGAVMQNAKVSATNEQTAEIRKLSSDANGSFEFLLLPVGTLFRVCVVIRSVCFKFGL